MHEGKGRTLGHSTWRPMESPHWVDEADVHNVHVEVVVAGLVVHVEAQLGGKARFASHTAGAPKGLALPQLQRR